MKKIFCLLLLSVIITTPSFAEQVTSLVLELADGTRSTFLFSETPVITIPDDNVNISCATSNISYNRQNIKKMYFEQTETAIKNIKIDESNVTFFFKTENTSRLADWRVVSLFVFTIFLVYC